MLPPREGGALPRLTCLLLLPLRLVGRRWRCAYHLRSSLASSRCRACASRSAHASNQSSAHIRHLKDTIAPTSPLQLVSASGLALSAMRAPSGATPKSGGAGAAAGFTSELRPVGGRPVGGRALATARFRRPRTRIFHFQPPGTPAPSAVLRRSLGSGAAKSSSFNGTPAIAAPRADVMLASPR